MKLTTEEVRHIALLARLGMSSDELDQMRDQMSHILQNFDVLTQVNTDGVEPTGHSVGLNTVMRDDETSDSSPIDDILANAPLREKNFLRVRAVLE